MTLAATRARDAAMNHERLFFVMRRRYLTHTYTQVFDYVGRRKASKTGRCLGSYDLLKAASPNCSVGSLVIKHGSLAYRGDVHEPKRLFEGFSG
jgi:hypothetical protein